jgi:hypothetical protein
MHRLVRMTPKASVNLNKLRVQDNPNIQTCHVFVAFITGSSYAMLSSIAVSTANLFQNKKFLEELIAHFP